MNITVSSYPIRLCTLASSLYISFLSLSSSPATCTSWIRDTGKLEEANLQEQEDCPSTSSHSWQGFDELSIFPSLFGELPDLRGLTWELQEFCLGGGLHLCPDGGKSCPSKEFLQENTSVGLVCPSQLEAIGEQNACLQWGAFSTLSYKLPCCSPQFCETPSPYSICTFPTLATHYKINLE